MAQSNEQGGDELRKELERLYRCVVYDRIDDVDRKELWIKEVGIVVEKLSAIDRKQHELELLDRLEATARTADNCTPDTYVVKTKFIEAERERLGK